MRERFQPGCLLVLPSGRRVRVDRVRSTEVVCSYETRQPGDRRHGVSVSDADVVLTKAFCLLHCLLVEVAAA